jgi:predicted nucleic-acid-binding protein
LGLDHQAGFDTNVLVRYLVKDDPAQAAIVERLIAETVAEDAAIFLNTIVLCESVWVLETGYAYARAEIAEALEKLLLTQQFEFEEREHAWRAVKRFREGKADFADYIIGEKNRSFGCERTSTFDRALKDEEGFEFLAA